MAILLLLASLPPLAAQNDPGGGAAGYATVVALSETSTNATVSNGRITAVIGKTTAKVSSYLFDGVQMVDPANPIYYSMDGGTDFEVPSGFTYAVVSSSADMVHLRFTRPWTGASGQKHAFDIELNWILRRGDTGLYAYAVLNHPASYPAETVGEWRIVWKLPKTGTAFDFERSYVDSARHWEMPSYYDYQQASSTPIGEIVKLNTGIWAGRYDGKYSYAARYFDIGTWGHASNVKRKGVWFVLGGHDYFNSGPTHQDLSSSESYILMHFGRNHFGGAGISVAAGESWRKMFGPFLLYCNGTSQQTSAGDALWADAKAQVTAETAAWPYAWLTTADHPAAAGRGTVSGRLVIQDALKPIVTAAGAWVGLAAAEDVAGNWQDQAKAYQYWTRADGNGAFSLGAVRPGTYTLYAFNTGAVGEYSRTGVVVTAGGTNALGDVVWTIANPGASLAWEIGVPDRTSAEFRNGNRHWEPYIWEDFSNQLPNPLVYTIGTSVPSQDWNYAHCGYRTVDPATGAVTYPTWDWQVKFQLPAVPTTGEAVLTVAYSSSHYTRAWVHVNGASTALARLAPSGTSGNALLRQGNHAKYSYERIAIPVSQLLVGENTLTFRYSGASGSADHVMYDYVSLHLPAFPPPPPDSLRTVTWVGGATTAASTWDNGVTTSFTSGGGPAAFGTGDTVLFTDTGSATVPVTLNGALEAKQVTFNHAVRSYTLGGTGSLSGPMSMLKKGAGTLTLTSANAFTGPCVIEAGTLAFGTVAATAAGLGTAPVRLSGGVLQCFQAGTGTSVSAPWNLEVPAGADATLRTAWRSTVTGRLTGAGVLRIVIPNGSIRASFSGEWDGFGGLLSVSPSTVGGVCDFRMGSDYAWSGIGGSQLELGAGVSAYWPGNLNQGVGTFVSIGDLTGSGTLRGGTIPGRRLTYRIGGRGGDVSFSGTIGEQTNGLTSLVKQGVGTWTVSGPCQVNGDIAVESGRLVIAGAWNAGGTFSVGTSARATVNGTMTAGSVRVDEGGVLDGAGTCVGAVQIDGRLEVGSGTFQISGPLTVGGEVHVAPGAVLSISGDCSNSGLIRVGSGGRLEHTGAQFVNAGVLDLVTASSAVPSSLVDSGGTVHTLEAFLASPPTLLLSGASTSLAFATIAGRTYQVQQSASLMAPVWANVGAPLVGDGGSASIALPAPTSGGAVYYRVVVGP